MTVDEHLDQIGMSREEWDNRRAIMKVNRERFMEEYKTAHACCPECGHKGHSTTYMGFIVTMGEDMEVANKDTFRDENKVMCGRCGWSGVTHDLVPKGTVMPMRIVYGNEVNGRQLPEVTTCCPTCTEEFSRFIPEEYIFGGLALVECPDCTKARSDEHGNLVIQYSGHAWTSPNA